MHVIEMEELVIKRLNCTQKHLNEIFPNLKIIKSRGYIKINSWRLIKSFVCSIVFMFLFPMEQKECRELFWNTVKEHNKGYGFDIVVMDGKKPLVQLPWYNVFMTKKQAKELWKNYNVLDFIEIILNNHGIRLAFEVREKLQMHCCLTQY